VQAVVRELFGRDIAPDIAGSCRLGQEVPDQVAKPLLRSGEVLTSMHECCEFAAVVLGVVVFSSDLQNRQLLMVVASGAALLVLLVLTALSVYKSQGMTRYGWRKQHDQRALLQP
jgi:hypothetical protein